MGMVALNEKYDLSRIMALGDNVVKELGVRGSGFGATDHGGLSGGAQAVGGTPNPELRTP